MSATNRGAQRRANDLYETPGWCTRAILPHLGPLAGRRILEPAVGGGAIVRELLAAGADAGRIVVGDISAKAVASMSLVEPLSVYAWDFPTEADQWVNATRQDGFDLVITNPPYSLALEFAQAGLRLLAPGGQLALLLRLNWLASQKRAAWMRANTPDVYVLPKRPSFTGGQTDATEYAWMVWTRGDNGECRGFGRVRVLDLTDAMREAA